MKFDRSKFFEGYRQQFRALNQTQVEGLERLLWGVETYYGWWDNIDQIANAFSQIKHETAHSFHPCVEGYYLGDSKASNYYTGNTDRVRRFQASLRYFPHFGRGDIQLTWEENYRDQSAFVRKYFPEVVAEFEARTLQRFDLVAHPEQALDGKISFCIVTIGMHKGTFRPGHTLDRYINANGADHFNARDIVNGDKHYKQKPSGTKIGTAIAADALRFTKVLRASLVDASENDIVEVSAAVPATETRESVTEIAAPEPLGGETNSAAKPPTSSEAVGFKPEQFNAFLPQIDTAKAWIKRATAGTMLGTAATFVFGLPQWLQIGLFSMLMIIVIGGIVMFVMYHKEIFAYVTKMNTLRATDGVNDPVIVGKPPTD